MNTYRRFTWAIVLFLLLSLIRVDAADDESNRRIGLQQLLDQHLDKHLALTLPPNEQVTQHLAFITRMIARETDTKKALEAARKYWAMITKRITESPQYDDKNAGFLSLTGGNSPSSAAKTLLQQALMTAALLDAVQIDGNDECRTTAKETLNFVLRDWRLSTGGFAAAIIPKTSPNADQPATRDESMNPSWNGLLVAAFARGYIVLGHQDYYTAAVQLAEFLLTRCTNADDCLSVIHGALTLYQVTGEARWLAAAITLQDRMDHEFWSEEETNYRLNDRIYLPQELEIMNLLQLITITDDDAFRDRANALITAAVNRTGGDLTHHPGLLCALDQQLGPNPHLTMVGDPAAADTHALFMLAHRRYQPRLVIVTHAGDPIQAELRQRFPAMVPPPKVKGKSTAYLCVGMLCNRPVTDPKELDIQLSEISYR